MEQADFAGAGHPISILFVAFIIRQVVLFLRPISNHGSES
jgi:hypothetical protein